MRIFLNGVAVGVGVVLAIAFGGAVAAASPSSHISVQDDGGPAGAGIDYDGTQGDIDSDGTLGEFIDAVEGSMTGPLMNAAPQTHAGG